MRKKKIAAARRTVVWSVIITEDDIGYIVKVKLMNEETNPDFFTVDMFVNEGNMRIASLEKSMKMLRLQRPLIFKVPSS